MPDATIDIDKLDRETSSVEKDNVTAVDRGVHFLRQHEEFKLVPVLRLINENFVYNVIRFRQLSKVS